jgi:hypothetical protein
LFLFLLNNKAAELLSLSRSLQAGYPDAVASGKKSTASGNRSTASGKIDPRPSALPAAATSPASQVVLSATPTREASVRRAVATVVRTENVISDVNKLQHELQVQTASWQTKFTALKEDARKQRDLATAMGARLSAMEAQLARVLPPDPTAVKVGRAKGVKAKGASADNVPVLFTSGHESNAVILAKRVSDLEKGTQGLGQTVKTAAKEILVIQKQYLESQPVATMTVASAGHVQYDLQKDVTSNTNRIGVVEGQNAIAVATQGMFTRQITELEKKITTIDEGMKQTVLESKNAVQPPTRKNKRTRSLQTEDDESSEETLQHRRTPNKRYVVCVMCLLLVFLQLSSAKILLPYTVILCFIASHPRRRSIVTIFLMVCLCVYRVYCVQAAYLSTLARLARRCVKEIKFSRQ